MIDQAFFGTAKTLSLAEVLSLGAAECSGGEGAEVSFSTVGALDEVGAEGVSFLHNRKYRKQLAETKAGLVFVDEGEESRVPTGTLAAISADPYRSYAMVARAMYPLPAVFPGIAPSANVDAAAVLGDGVAIGPNVVIGPRAVIGAGTAIGANTVIGEGVKVGRDCRIGPNNSISHAHLADRVRTLAGVNIGERGFGFAMGPLGHAPIPQLGRVLIGYDVEVGAGTCIDRGAGPDTVVGDGTKIDNLVQIGHNVKIGRACIICGTVAIAGSAVLEDFCVLGGGSALNGHITLGMGTRIGASSGVMSSTEPGSTLVGTPAMDSRRFMKYQASLYRLTGVKR